MIESQGRWQVRGAKNACILGIVGSHRHPRCLGDEYGRNRMVTRIPPRVRVDIKKLFQMDHQAGLLPGFPACTGFHTFAPIQESPGNGPAVGWIPALDQNDATGHLDDDIDGGQRVAIRPGHVLSPVCIEFEIVSENYESQNGLSTLFSPGSN
ncbi:hypothetical protein DESC_120180 [Desulfosarcina cetonica]|nr:hypothetical protein DESC_120180 [Desulfosarcina cetonica]